MIRASVIAITLLLFSVLLFGAVVTAATIRPSAQRQAATSSISTVKSGSISATIPSLKPDTSRKPVVPEIRDETRLATLPSGMGIVSRPSALPWPVKTNSWWSSGILEKFPAPLYPLPFKGIFSMDGLILSVPHPHAQDKTVFAGEGDPLRIFGDKSAVSTTAIASGDFDVTFRTIDAGQRQQFDATFIQGSPFVFIRTRLSQLGAALPANASTSPVSCNGKCGSALSVNTPGSQFLLVSPLNNAFTVRGGVVDIRMEQSKSLLTVVALGQGSDVSQYLAPAVRPFSGTRAEYAVTNSAVTTTFRFPQETIIGYLPHQEASLSSPAGPVIGTFDTVRGQIRMRAGKSFSTSLTRPSIIPSLPPLQTIRGDATFKAQLSADIAENKTPSGDIYFAAKDFYRIAQLAELADLSGDNALRDRAVSQARRHLAAFCTADPASTYSFGYDKSAGGIIALPPGFGSEHYNDHHFHYGYFIHAAAIVGRYDSDFLRRYGNCFRLLMRDIASPDRKDASFPYLRYFDPYGGHSWAGGITLFGDGNNQESTSEAVHAWYAMALYGRTIGDRDLENLGTWMFAQESQSAKVYWLNGEPKAPSLPASFQYPMVSILWGGKADYATFFDPSDQAIRGIQFFPVSMAIIPVLSRMTVEKIVDPAIANNAPRTIWKTGLTFVAQMYHLSLPLSVDDPLDPVYSKSFAAYWEKAFRQLGEPVSPMGNCAGQVFRKGNVLTAVAYRFAGDPDSCSVAVSGKRIDITGMKPGWNVKVTQ